MSKGERLKMRSRFPRAVRLGAVLAVAAAMVAVPAVGQDSSAITPAAGAELEVAQLTGPLMLQLEGAPAALVYANEKGRGASDAAAAAASKQQKQRNEQAQQAVVQAVGSADVLYTVQTAYNGVAVTADSPDDAARFAAISGVAAVHPIPLAEPHNASSVGFIGAHQAWQTFGETGEGMTIAVIDTGIDYVHTGFGGSGTAADYAAAKSAANNVETTNPQAAFSIPGIYPTPKVVGGHDLVGDAYNASGNAAAQTPHPDRNPMDCNGHGSHVAGTAAGNGVNANGSTYTGPYDASIPASTMRIGPGVAPGAKIKFYRVFGCAGSTALTTAAIDMAIDPNGDGNPADHVDVINMSLGSPYGTADDPSAAASQNAALNGVIVVASAGNNSDVYNVTGSPASSTRTISVASSADPVDVTDAFRVNSPASIAGLYGASRSVNFNWLAPPASAPLPMTANLYYPTSNQFGCSSWVGNPEAANIVGKILLVDWKVGSNPFPCGSATRVNNAQAAGAKGVIMADSVPYLDTAIGGNSGIPAMYTTSTVGDELKGALAGGAVSITFSNEWLNSFRLTTAGRGDMLSGFSSRGPRSRGASLKPDIAAPGQGIFSVGNGTGSQGLSNQGTSMAAPHIAGVMALLKGAHPNWSVEELKALAMNTAGHDLYTGLGQTGDRYGVARVGAGRVDVPAALETDVVAYDANAAGGVSMSFGAVEVLGNLMQERTVRVVNNGSSARSYALGYSPRTDIPGVEFSFPSNDTVTVPAGGSATFRVRMTANASDMRNTRDATVLATQAGLPRHWLSEESGLITLTPQGGAPALRLPAYATARPATKMGASGNNITFTGVNSASNTIHLSGQDVATGAEPLGYLSKVSAFELQAVSPRASLPAGVSELARNADIRYVGAALNTAKNEVFFGINTWGEWAIPATDVQFSIQIDADRNGTVDRTLFNTRFTDTDVLVTAVTVGASTLVADFTNVFAANVNTAPFDNDVVVMPILVSQLGLPTGATRFNYRVQGLSRFWPQIDETGWMTYDVGSPGISFSGGLAGAPMFPDLNNSGISVSLNRATYNANGSLGALLLHHFNEQGSRAEVLRVNR